MRVIFVASVVLASATPGLAFWPAVPRLPASAVAAATRADTERDPLKLAKRIGKNARAAGDLLLAKDTGETTRATQSKILRDMDRLLEQAGEPPPPQGGDGDPPPPQGDPPPQGGQPPPNRGGQPPPQGGNPPDGGLSPKPQGGQPQPKGGGKSSWRDKADDEGGEPMPQPGKPRGGKPELGKADASPGKPGGAAAGPVRIGKPESHPAPPAEDAVAKQVWGHLPEQLRREMNHYYKEQFMPKYGDMLRDYYSGLAEASRPGGRGPSRR